MSLESFGALGRTRFPRALGGVLHGCAVGTASRREERNSLVNYELKKYKKSREGV